jgi:hypothetical protein
VMPTLSLAFTLAFFASSAPTTSKWPLKEALWSGVRLSCGAGQHRGQGLLPCKYMLPIAHTNTCTLSDRARTHAHIRIHAVAGWGRQGYLALAAATYRGPCLSAGWSLTDPGAYSLWRPSRAAEEPA